MRVKKYQAVDMPDALRQIKEDLGPDAVILSTRQVKPGKGVFGMLGRPLLEVTAAAGAGIAPPPTLGTSQPRPEPPSRSDGHGAILALQADVESLREELGVIGRRPRPRQNDALNRDIQALSRKIDQLLEQTGPFDRLRLCPELRRLHAHLDAIDLEPGLSSRILTYLQDKVDQGVVGAGQELEAFKELVRRTVQVSGSLLPKEAGRKVVALVGPTGVGKTTTVAKLAARMALQDGHRVGLVTVDTFRIAAVEQLKSYARIMGIPIRVAMDAPGLRSSVEDLADRELVLVDTAGQSPKDEESLINLLELFPDDVSVEVHLVLSLTTRARDLEKILRHYAPVKATRLLLTKLDETDCCGPLLGLPLAARLPLSYVTTGQNVPDDIEQATPSLVLGRLLGGLGLGP